MYLLDTNVLSDSLKAEPNQGLVDFLNIHESNLLFISNISIAEIAYGIELMPKGKRQEMFALQLQNLIQDFEGRILGLSLQTALNYGTLRAEQKKQGLNDSIFDTLLIATAKEHSLTIVTRNEKDFLNRGVKLLNPYT